MYSPPVQNSTCAVGYCVASQLRIVYSVALWPECMPASAESAVLTTLWLSFL